MIFWTNARALKGFSRAKNQGKCASGHAFGNRGFPVNFDTQLKTVLPMSIIYFFFLHFSLDLFYIMTQKLPIKTSR